MNCTQVGWLVICYVHKSKGFDMLVAVLHVIQLWSMRDPDHIAKHKSFKLYGIHLTNTNYLFVVCENGICLAVRSIKWLFCHFDIEWLILQIHLILSNKKEFSWYGSKHQLDVPKFILLVDNKCQVNRTISLNVFILGTERKTFSSSNCLTIIIQ